MNRLQWIIVALAVATLLAMGLFPPWAYVERVHLHASDGYHWLFHEPNPDEAYESRINGPLLTKQSMVVLAITLALVFVTRKPRHPPP